MKCTGLSKCICNSNDSYYWGPQGFPFNSWGFKSSQIWDYWLLIPPCPLTSHDLNEVLGYSLIVIIGFSGFHIPISWKIWRMLFKIVYWKKKKDIKITNVQKGNIIGVWKNDAVIPVMTTNSQDTICWHFGKSFTKCRWDSLLNGSICCTHKACVSSHILMDCLHLKIKPSVMCTSAKMWQ